VNLAIYGAGGLGREVLDLALRRNRLSHTWHEVVFIDDSIGELNGSDIRIVSLSHVIENRNDFEVIIAVGEPSSRELIYNRLVEAEINMAKLIDTTAVISPNCQIGRGTIVCEFASIHAGVNLGENVLVQPYCAVGHDVSVGDHAVLGPFATPGGGSRFGKRVYLGMKATVREGLVIGDDAIVGMASAVFRDVDAQATVIGNPARITRGNELHRVFQR
jgi:sugar O-acyltransferase (sialic acid O-acetyltransferase NeuD family)